MISKLAASGVLVRWTKSRPPRVHYNAKSAALGVLGKKGLLGICSGIYERKAVAGAGPVQ